MSRTKCMVQELVGFLQYRISDVLSFGLKRANENIINTIQLVNSKENQRLRDVLKLQMKINDIVREETNQSITDIGKCLFGGTLSIFQAINKEFRPERHIKHDYNGLIYLFREYFIASNDIRMVTKLEDLFRNKAIKKPVILTKLLKMLIDITRNYFIQNVKTVNQGITKCDVQEYNQQKTQQLKKNLPKIMQATIKRTTLKVVCPIFIMDSVTRFEEQEEPANDKVKFGNLLFLRNKLKEKLHQRTMNKQNIDERINKPVTRLESYRKHMSSLVPMDITYLTKLETQHEPEEPQINLGSSEIMKPLTTQLIRKTRNVRSRYSKESTSKTLPVTKPQEKFRDFSGVASYRNNYSVLDLDQKNITMVFLKKARKYFSEIQYKELLQRNRDINKQIGSFKP